MTTQYIDNTVFRNERDLWNYLQDLKILQIFLLFDRASVKIRQKFEKALTIFQSAK
jgi:hypothetical protein